MVVYLMRTDAPTRMVGFAVSKAVGGAVVRNRVKRRLRAIVTAELPSVPKGTSVVVRALPGAGAASFALLASDVRAALSAASAKVAA